MGFVLRINIVHDVQRKLQQLLPKWHHIPVLCEAQDALHTAGQAGTKSQWVWVSVPPCCKTEKVSLTSVFGAVSPGEKVRFKCFAGDGCVHRKGVQAVEGGEFAEIPGEAKDDDDAFTSMLLEEGAVADDAEVEEAEAMLDLIEEADSGGTQDPAAKSKTFERAVFPHQARMSSFGTLFKNHGAANECKYCICVTSTAHPSVFMAARENSLSCNIWVRKGTAHALSHGKSLAISWRLTQLLKEMPAAGKTAPSQNLQLIEVEFLPGASDIISPFDVSKGDRWFDGLDNQFLETSLDELTPRVIDEERDALYVAVTAARAKVGKGLTTVIPRGPKAVIGSLACLWFSSRKNLLKHLEEIATGRKNFNHPTKGFFLDCPKPRIF